VYVHARMHVVVVGHREPTRGEDNVRRVLSRFVFLVVAVSVFIPVDGYIGI